MSSTSIANQKRSRKGFFISLESIDGLGKTTQFMLLNKLLNDNGHEVYLTKEPGDSEIGCNIGAGVRQLLFHNPTTKYMHPGVADMLFLADHLQAQGDVAYWLSLGENVVVLADRFADSQFAYMGSPTKQTPAWAKKVYAQQYTVVPDLTILLIARGPVIGEGYVDSYKRSHLLEDISWALKRGKARSGVETNKQDGKRWNSVEEQRRIQDTYLYYLAGLPRTVIVDVWETNGIDEIHQNIMIETMRRLVQFQYKRTQPDPQIELPYAELLKE